MSETQILCTFLSHNSWFSCLPFPGDLRGVINANHSVFLCHLVECKLLSFYLFICLSHSLLCVYISCLVVERVCVCVWEYICTYVFLKESKKEKKNEKKEKGMFSWLFYDLLSLAESYLSAAQLPLCRVIMYMLLLIVICWTLVWENGSRKI